jgi:hypothetical protein
LISKEELLNSVWGDDTAVTEGSLTRCICLLRRLLGDDINDPRFIETVATVGYRLVCQVKVSEDASRDLQAADKANGLNEGDFVETPANGENAEPRRILWCRSTSSSFPPTNSSKRFHPQGPSEDLCISGWQSSVWRLLRLPRCSMEGRFPHAHDQWISSAATNWAAMALTLALPDANNVMASRLP